MRKLFTGLIWIYQGTLSPLLRTFLGKGCRFSPTCSQYAQEAIWRYGVLKGGFLAVKRVFKCNPFSTLS